MNSKQTKRRRAVKIVSLLAVLFVLAFTVSAPVFAGVEIEGDPDVTIEAGEVIKDDVFIGGRHVLVAGTIEGDLFVSGETVTISGTVDGNLFATGTVVNLSGTVDGAAVLGAYSVVVEPGAVITRNLYFGGFNLEVQEDAVVQRSLYGGGYQIQISGQIDRHVVAGVGAFAADGTIAGDLKLEVGDPSSDVPDIYFGDPISRYEVDMLEPGLYLEDDVVGGDLDYRYSYMETDFDIDTDIDQTVSDAVSMLVSNRLRNRAGEFLAILMLGALLLYAAKDWLVRVVEEIKTNALRDTGTGLLIFLLYLPAVFVLFVAFGAVVVLGSFLTFGAFTGELIAFTGISFSALLAVFGLLVTFGAQITFSYLFGRWILEKGSQLSFENFWHHFGALALGAFLYEAVRVIPVFGFLLAVVLGMIGIGALFFVLRDRFRKEPAAAAVVE